MQSCKLFGTSRLAGGFLFIQKGSYGFRNCLILFWYRERDLNSQDVAIGGF